MDIDLSQLNNLDFSNIGNWPKVARIIVIVILCVLVLFAGYWFDTQDQINQLDTAQQKENTLKQEFEQKQKQAASLDAYQRQMADMKQSFGTMLRQLPSKTEVADLLVDITQTGLAAGLHFDLFKPGEEDPKDFYAELPIEIKVEGGYRNFGRFVSGVASLPRIVTLHDIRISGRGKAASEGLVMEATAKTYRYLDQAEIEAARHNSKHKRR